MARSKDYDDDSVDQSPHDPSDPGPPLSPEESARLAELRGLAALSPLDDASQAELAALALKEADAAGHPKPEAIDAAAPVDPTHAMIGEVLAFLESVVDTVPALNAMRGRLNMLKDSLGRLTAPKP